MKLCRTSRRGFRPYLLIPLAVVQRIFGRVELFGSLALLWGLSNYRKRWQLGFHF
jgi:hypothetical protein